MFFFNNILAGLLAGIFELKTSASFGSPSLA
jgi:hypothetical protein